MNKFEQGYYELSSVIRDCAEGNEFDNTSLRTLINVQNLLGEALKEQASSIDLLSSVAKMAALACIDLDANLNATYREWMDGTIARGAYEHTLTRHSALHKALFNAGFTEKHKTFEFPVKPEAG